MSFIEDLISKMSIADKAGQMTQVSLDVICEGEPYKVKKPLRIMPGKLREAVSVQKVGSIINVGTEAHRPEKWNDIIAKIQHQATKHTPFNIPVLYGIDSIHGANFVNGSSLYPQPLALASTWNKALVESLASITAYETKAAGIPWNFSPVLDVGRLASWPRLWETFGEDVFLCSEMGVAMIKGLQGDDIAEAGKVAACMKHFVGYGQPLSGKDRTPAWIPERQLQEYFLPPFQKAVEAGVATVMINSGEINGIPVHISYHLLTTILRDEMGFKGLVVTDWEDIKYLHDRHRVASSQKEAVRLAIEAGIDMSMVPSDFSFTKYLIELVKEGSISEERLDVSVRRILTLKKELGLFEMTHHTVEGFPLFGSDQHQSVCKQGALESIILLKNNKGILPLSKESKILLCGPTADNMRCLNGGWTYTWQGELTDEFTKDKITIRKAITNLIGENNVDYVKACDYEVVIDIEKAVEAAAATDAIVMCLGENSYTEFFGSINDLYLPDAQMELARALAKTGKPIVLILVQGRPRLISKFEESVDGILLSFLPGNEGGEAFAATLFGDHNPAGRLPITYPKYPNSLENYDYKYAENLPLQGFTGTIEPQFEFGFGLSYTRFEYSDLKLDKTLLNPGSTVTISLKVHNIGKHPGNEAILVYISDLYASITPPNKRIRAFKLLSLDAQQTKEIQFVISPDDLSFVNIDNEWVTESGKFLVRIGDLTKEFEFNRVNQ